MLHATLKMAFSSSVLAIIVFLPCELSPLLINARIGRKMSDENPEILLSESSSVGRAASVISARSQHLA